MEAMDLTEAALKAGTRYGMMRDLILSGRVRGWREDRRWNVDPESLERFLAENGTGRPDDPRSLQNTE